MDDDAISAPRAFMSYSHDTDAHKAWVLRLADRLVRNGVDVVLDQWDARLGSDLPMFMEQGLTSADRVIAVCSDSYVDKANKGLGGVGYEKRIITAEIMVDLTSNRVVPVIRNNDSARLPTFMGKALYQDFRIDTGYESSYAALIYELHGEQLVARPPLGPNPFRVVPNVEVANHLRNSSDRYISPTMSGHVDFHYENNSGRFTIGSGERAFTIDTSPKLHQQHLLVELGWRRSGRSGSSELGATAGAVFV